jgi:hypothetical protein
MVTSEDHELLARAAELISGVMERHRGEDLRALTIFNSVVHDLRVAERYLGAVKPALSA